MKIPASSCHNYNNFIRDFLANLSKRALDIILPHNCFGCNKFTSSYGLCNICWHGISFISNSICHSCGLSFLAGSLRDDSNCYNCHLQKLNDELPYHLKRSLIHYDANSKKLIHRLKYGGHTFLAEYFARLLACKYSHDFSQIDAIVPVPMHPLRRILRTYNQAQLFAKKLADNLQTPLHSNLLVKKKFSRSQSSLTRAGRLKNLQGSIALNKAYSGHEFKKILLVDDVYTTGATVSICIQALQALPSKPQVRVVTIATTLLQG